MLYLASPYSDPNEVVRDLRALTVMRAASQLAIEGIPVYSPIAHWHYPAKLFTLPKDADFWRRLNFAILARCTELGMLLIPGWRESKGMEEEYQEALRLGLPVNDYQLDSGCLLCLGMHPPRTP